jgi:hypothetical protein
VRYPFDDGVVGEGVQEEHCAESAQQLGVFEKPLPVGSVDGTPSRCAISSLQHISGGDKLLRHTSSLSGQLLFGRVGMWQAVIAEFAHPQLIDRLIWSSALGTRLANVRTTERFFQCEFDCNYSLAAECKPNENPQGLSESAR